MSLLAIVIAVFLPALLILIAYKYGFSEKLYQFIDRKFAEPSINVKAGVGTFLCSWLFPLVLLVTYKLFIEGVVLSAADVISYTIILGCTAALGILHANVKHCNADTEKPTH